MERYVDKKIKVLESICHNDFSKDYISNLKQITPEEVTAIIKEFQYYELLKIKDLIFNRLYITDPIYDEPLDDLDELTILYEVINRDELSHLLATLKKNYPKHNKPIIRAQTLRKIAAQIEKKATDLSVIELLRQWGVPIPDIMHSKANLDMAFSILNHYAFSTKQKDHAILTKIIEEIFHPLMSDGDMEKLHKTVAKFNTLLSFDNYSLYYSDKDTKYKLALLKRKPLNNEKKLHAEQHRKQTHPIIGDISKADITNEPDSKTNATTFTIKIRDREIYVNNWIISKPYATGSNFEFFEYVRLQPSNVKLHRNMLPDSGGLSLKKQVENKGFIKILNGLGFKGEILKAFFYARSKDTLTYRGNKITNEDLKNAGVKIPLFIKQLELAHIKNSPK